MIWCFSSLEVQYLLTCDNTDTLPRNDSFFDTRSFSGDVGAEVVLFPGLPVMSDPVCERELGIDGGSRGEVAPLLSPL